MNPYEGLVDADVYARLEGNRVVEYPVYGLHIRNRAHPIDWYTKVEFLPKPELPAFHSYQETLVAQQGGVIASYTVTPLSLNILLSQITPDRRMFPGQEEQAPVDITTLDPALVGRVAELIAAHVQKRLDTFAQTKGFDGILSAASYKGDADPVFNEEGTRASTLRTDTWKAFYAYQDGVLAGTTPVPKTLADIDAVLPALTWA